MSSFHPRPHLTDAARLRDRSARAARARFGNGQSGRCRYRCGRRRGAGRHLQKRRCMPSAAMCAMRQAAGAVSAARHTRADLLASRAFCFVFEISARGRGSHRSRVVFLRWCWPPSRSSSASKPKLRQTGADARPGDASPRREHEGRRLCVVHDKVSCIAGRACACMERAQGRGKRGGLTP